MTTHDDFTAAEQQLAHADLTAVMRAIRKGTLDFTRPVHVAARSLGADPVPVSAKVPSYIVASIDELHGNGRKYKNRSQVIVQALCMLLTYEAHQDEGGIPDPAVIKAAQDTFAARRQILADTIETCWVELHRGGDQVRQTTFVQLEQLRIAAKADGLDDHVSRINEIFRTERYMAHLENAEKVVNSLNVDDSDR